MSIPPGVNPNEIPGLLNPSGAPPNFAHPSSESGAFFGVCIFYLMLTTITTLLRMYTRIWIVKSVGWPDCFAACAAIKIANRPYGEGVHQWDIPITHLIPFAKSAYVYEATYNVVLAIAKLSICLQYVNIFAPGRSIKFWFLQVLIFVNTSFQVAAFFITLFQCSPRAKAWNSTIPGSCVKFKDWIIVTGVYNIASDAIMLIFPIFCIWTLQMSTSRKWGVSGIFFVGVLALVSSIIRLIFSFVYKHSQDLTFTESQLGIATTGEIAAGIVAGNLICLPRLFKHYGPKVLRFISSNYQSSQTTGQSHNRGNSDKKSSSSWPHRHVKDRADKSNDYMELQDVLTYPELGPIAPGKNRLFPLNTSQVSAQQEPQTVFEDDRESDNRRKIWRSVRVEQNAEQF
ncbi:hypothetical protein EV356DRAFT_581600 [Viridothelium virens]|uniref:Rhodopsin domain-containing protein n=1 Tax=Viridothelium virens TaxID=1048519 RepID=A0A6A6GRW1_VIRVR|nr:hypothetical protein EV356DRAFT_581600 [Viridothelium virens]